MPNVLNLPIGYIAVDPQTIIFRLQLTYPTTWLPLKPDLMMSLYILKLEPRIAANLKITVICMLDNIQVKFILHV